MARVVAVLTATVLLVLPAAAEAEGPSWTTEEAGSIASSWELGQMKVDPLGDYFIGMGEDGYQDFEVRGPGPAGTYSALQPVPGAGDVGGVDYAFESNGGSWWIVASGSAVKVMHRTPGQFGAFESATTLDSVVGGALDHAAVGVSPGGDVLAVWESGEESTDASLKAAVKPAGASSFSTPQTLASGIAISGPIGATLDAGGSAVVVWGEGTGCSPYCTGVDLKQMTRPAGPVEEPDLEGTTTLASYSGTLSESYFNAHYADSLGGHAVLAYEDEPPGSEQIFMYARTREPGVGFGAAATLSSGSESGRHLVVVPGPRISVAADGSAALAWTELVPCGGSASFAAYAMASFAPPGSGFGTPAQLASGDAYETGPRPYAPAVGIAGEGEWIGGWGSEESEQPLCGPHSSSSYGVALTHAGTGTPIFASVGSHEDLESVRAAANPVSGGYEGLVVWTSGEPASIHDVKAARFEDVSAGPPEEKEEGSSGGGGGSSSSGGGAGSSSSGGGGPSGQGSGHGEAEPPAIVPRQLVSASGFRQGKPEVTVSCPAKAAHACAVHVDAYTNSGALPRHSARAARAQIASARRGHRKAKARRHRGKRGRRHARKATLLGDASATVAPGKHKNVELHLTKAGRHLVKAAHRRHRVTPMRLVVRISSGGQTGRSMLKAKLRPPRRKGKRKGRRRRGHSARRASVSTEG